jgi:hypothetical protein
MTGKREVTQNIFCIFLNNCERMFLLYFVNLVFCLIIVIVLLCTLYFSLYFYQFGISIFICILVCPLWAQNCPQVTDKLDQIIIFFNIPSIARIYITLDAKFAGCLHYPGEQNLTILGSFKYILFLI